MRDAVVDQPVIKRDDHAKQVEDQAFHAIRDG
jgi:hypothetical protein